MITTKTEENTTPMHSNISIDLKRKNNVSRPYTRGIASKTGSRTTSLTRNSTNR
jgi:hypothetical protein